MTRPTTLHGMFPGAHATFCGLVITTLPPDEECTEELADLGDPDGLLPGECENCWAKVQRLRMILR